VAQRRIVRRTLAGPIRVVEEKLDSRSGVAGNLLDRVVHRQLERRAPPTRVES